jgi:hypothetical protein
MKITLLAAACLMSTAALADGAAMSSSSSMTMPGPTMSNANGMTAKPMDKDKKKPAKSDAMQDMSGNAMSGQDDKANPPAKPH